MQIRRLAIALAVINLIVLLTLLQQRVLTAPGLTTTVRAHVLEIVNGRG